MPTRTPRPTETTEDPEWSARDTRVPYAILCPADAALLAQIPREEYCQHVLALFQGGMATKAQWWALADAVFSCATGAGDQAALLAPIDVWVARQVRAAWGRTEEHGT